jgi:hypothetical protein
MAAILPAWPALAAFLAASPAVIGLLIGLGVLAAVSGSRGSE